MSQGSTLSAEEFQCVLDEAQAEVGPEAAAVWERYRVEPARVKCARQGGDAIEPLWVVAAFGDERLGYDAVQSEFGSGVLDSQGVLRQWGTWGSLRNALLHFPEDD